ncbi:UNVERIFIED_CONTAM: hypothetical protein Sradi_4129800 [Sesamum radiatum]|uniref:Uncharacterized protein n=1 Tax=Sesamum radiatum TaxID=300843 RepID=A0AAW2P519_SESRA
MSMPAIATQAMKIPAKASQGKPQTQIQQKRRRSSIDETTTTNPRQNSQIPEAQNRQPNLAVPALARSQGLLNKTNHCKRSHQESKSPQPPIANPCRPLPQQRTHIDKQT